MKHRKLNKKGFSLVELIAAVAILSVVVSPLLHSFVTSTNVSRRTTQISEATLAAKNILEAVDATDISSFQVINDDNACNLLSIGDDDGISITPIGEFQQLKDQDVIKTEGFRDNAYYQLGSDEEDVIAKKLIDDVNGNFVVAVKDLKAGSNTFDAKVEFTRGDYDETTHNDYQGNLTDLDASSNGIYQINSKDIVQYANHKDSVFTQPYIKSQNPDSIADKRFMELASTDSTIDTSSFNRNREIRIFIYKDESDLVTVRVKYYYDYDYNILDADGYSIEDNVNGGFITKLKSNDPDIRQKANGHYDPRFSIELPTSLYQSEAPNKDGSVSLFLAYFPTFDPETLKYGEDKITIYSVARESGVYIEPDLQDDYDWWIESGGDPSEYWGGIELPKLTQADFELFLYVQQPLDEDYNPLSYDQANQYKATVTVCRPDTEFDSENPNSYNFAKNTKRLIYTNIKSESCVKSQKQISYQNFDPDDIDRFNASGYSMSGGGSLEEARILNSVMRTDTYLKTENSIRMYNIRVVLYPQGTFGTPVTETQEIDGADRVTKTTLDFPSEDPDDENYVKPVYKLEGTKTPR